jgi:fermentation-respiration switch protein FrsA (DUF1100 family)
VSIIQYSAVLLGFFFEMQAKGSPSYCESVAGNYVQNCGFEASNTLLTGWTLNGNGNPYYVAPGAGNSTVYIDLSDPNSGSNDAFLATPSNYGASGSGDQYGPPTTLSQTLTLAPGFYYSISFELANNGCSVTDGCPGSYNHFAVNFNGVQLFSADNLATTYNGNTGVTTYVPYSYTEAVSAISVPLSFDFTNDNGAFQLDDIVVTQAGAIAPEPGTLSLIGLSLAGLGAIAAKHQRHFLRIES